MKSIKAYLENQKDIALTMWANELQKYGMNLFLTNHWNNRVVVIEQLLKEIEDGKEKSKKNQGTNRTR